MVYTSTLHTGCELDHHVSIEIKSPSFLPVCLISNHKEALLVHLYYCSCAYIMLLNFSFKRGEGLSLEVVYLLRQLLLKSIYFIHSFV